MIEYISGFHAYVKLNPNKFCLKIKTVCNMIDKLLARKDIEYKPSQVMMFEKFCSCFKHIEGRQWEGKAIKLSNEQRWIVACLLGIKKYSKEHNMWLRYFKEARIFTARKWGKTLFLSLLVLFIFLADKEPGARCEVFAKNKTQARLLFDKIVIFLKSSPEISKDLKINVQYEDKKVILDPSTNSIITYGSAARTGKDGTNPSFFVIDEPHEITDHNMYDSQISGQGARIQSLGIIISTAGTIKNSLHSRFYNEIEDILKSKKFDDNIPIFPVVFEIDTDDKVENENCWIKANPGIEEGRPSLESLRRLYHKCKLGQDDNNIISFITKNLNRSCSDARTYYTTEILKSGRIDITSEHYYDTYAYGGVDLAEKTDLCSATIIIPYQHFEDENIFDFVVLQKYWIPETRVEKNSQNDKMIYRDFMCTKSQDEVCQSLLSLSKGDSVNFNDVAHWFAEMRDNYKLLFRKIGYDAAMSSQFVFAMVDRNFTKEEKEFDNDKKLVGRSDGVLTDVRQGKYLSEPIKMLKVLFEEDRIKYEKTNALLPYCLTNVKVAIDKDNKYEIVKKQSNGRIDGAASLLDAIQAFSCDRDKFIDEVLPYEKSNKLVDKRKVI